MDQTLKTDEKNALVGSGVGGHHERGICRLSPRLTGRWHLEIFYARADHPCAAGYEGEKRCMRKSIGGKKGKFGEQDEVRTVGMAAVPKPKRRKPVYLIVPKSLSGQKFG